MLELPTARPWEALPLLRAQHLDALVDLGQWSRLEAVYAGLSGAGWTTGFATPGQRRHYAYDRAVRHSDAVPELENFRALIAGLGLKPARLPWFNPDGHRTPPPVSRPYVVFHLWPGGFRSELREWPAKRWRELALVLAQEDLAILLTGAPADAPRNEEFLRSCGGVATPIISVAGRYRLPELVPLLAEARCVISVNTGVMHLAAAAGAATIALNGPTSAVRWGPVGPDVTCIDSLLPGCGYLNLGFEYGGEIHDMAAIQGLGSIERRRLAIAAVEPAVVRIEQACARPAHGGRLRDVADAMRPGVVRVDRDAMTGAFLY